MSPAELFAIGLAVGFVGPIAGIGGGVLLTPILLAYTDLDVDTARAIGLLAAMTTSSIAGSVYMARGMTRLNLVLAAALAMSAGSLAGARLGIAVAATYGAGPVKLALGVLILAAAATILLGRAKAGSPSTPDRLAKALGLYGTYYEESAGAEIRYGATRTPLALLALAAVGFISGFFGVGGGWALVPTYNLVMGLPIKVAVATSEATIALGDAAGALAYLESGKLEHIAQLAPPAQAGVAFGALLGARVAAKARPPAIRWAVVAILLWTAINLITARP